MYNAYSVIQDTAQHTYERVAAHIETAALAADDETREAIVRVLGFYRDARPAEYGEAAADAYCRHLDI